MPTEVDFGLWNVPAEVAVFLAMQIAIRRPKKILEIGGSSGFSSLHLALAAATYGGEVCTIESSPRRLPILRETITASGLQNYSVLEGHAPKVFAQLAGQKFDFVFLDATKRQYVEFIQELEKQDLLCYPTVIFADNATSHPEQIKEYLEYMRAHPRVTEVMIPFPAGLHLAILE